MAAGYETLKILSERRDLYADLDNKGKTLAQEIEGVIQSLDLPLRLNHIGSMFTLFFTEKEVKDYESAKSSDTSLFAAYFREMLEQGIYLPPSQFETAFLSMAHNDADIEKTVPAVRRALKRLFPTRFSHTQVAP